MTVLITTGEDLDREGLTGREHSHTPVEGILSSCGVLGVDGSDELDDEGDEASSSGSCFGVCDGMMGVLQCRVTRRGMVGVTRRCVDDSGLGGTVDTGDGVTEARRMLMGNTEGGFSCEHGVTPSAPNVFFHRGSWTETDSAGGRCSCCLQRQPHPRDNPL